MRILLVEDDAQLAEAIRYALTQRAHTVDVCHEGDDGFRWLQEGIYDLLLLDRMLPRLDGISLLRKARSQGIITPVVMMTALGTLSQVVEGLDSGADDYIVKPFAIEELLARVRAMERRPIIWDVSSEIAAGDLRLQTMTKTLFCGIKEISLSKRESDLLEILMKHEGQTLPRGTLLSYVWGPDAGVEEGNLENYIHFVRRRLRGVESKMTVTTARGVGYRLEDGDV